MALHAHSCTGETHQGRVMSTRHPASYSLQTKDTRQFGNTLSKYDYSITHPSTHPSISNSSSPPSTQTSYKYTFEHPSIYRSTLPSIYRIWKAKFRHNIEEVYSICFICIFYIAFINTLKTHTHTHTHA